MPVKRRELKRTRVIEKATAPPVKVGKHSVPAEPPQLFAASRNHDRGPGLVLTMGQGDVGQLGLGPNIMERLKPSLVPNLDNVVDVCAGGMHTICLTDAGEVITFGCNDEGALGRITSEEGSESVPGIVTLDNKAVQVSAGDSHSATLLEDGRVFAWGSFRDSHGPMGLTPSDMVTEPMHMDINKKVVKIASGTDHLLMLTKQGQLYTCGCGEQGQLGRLSERVSSRESRQGLNQLLKPAIVRFKGSLKFDSIWVESYGTFLQEKTRGDMYVFGLNNYKQLGASNVKDQQCHFHPMLSRPFSDKRWLKIAGGQHHTLALDMDGVVYSLGRCEYGRLGLGEVTSDVDTPTPVSALKDKKCVDIGCGSCVSYAVTDKGDLFAWGMGTNGQLGTGETDDQFEPFKVVGNHLADRSVIAVSGGGQHTVMLARPKLS